MKTSSLVFILVAAFVAVTADKGCHWREIDLCCVEAVISLRDILFPKDQEQINTQCAIADQTIGCLNNYTSSCTTPLHRQLISFVIEAPMNTLKDYCTPGSELSKSAMQYAQCLSEAWDESRSSCLLDAQAALEAITEAPFNQQLDMLCCTYQRYRKCCSGITRSKCGEEGVEFIEKTIGLVVSNLPNLVCNNCDGEDKCEALLPPPGTPPKGAESNSIVSQVLSMFAV